MKLKNKRTGEIGNLVLNINPNRESYAVLSTENGDTICGNLVLADYNSLAELNEEWCDYEEAKYYYAITSIKADDGITKMKNKHNDMAAFDKSIGNYFETKEEAEKAVEKLRALKRLKDKGFRFVCHMKRSDWADLAEVKALADLIDITACLPKDKIKESKADLDLLFGDEE